MRVLLADDHAIVRQGVRELLEEGGHQVVAEAVDGQEAVRMARELSPELCILDLSMPRLNGLDAAHEIRQTAPAPKIILLTMYESRSYVLRALKAGAKGYVLKTQAAEDLLRAIVEVSRGHIYLSPGVAPLLVDAYLEGVPGAVDPLTARERQMLQLIAEGNSTKQAARVLNISFKTAESHRNHIMRKLDIHEVAGLTRYAIHTGLVHLSDPVSGIAGAQSPQRGE